MTPRAPRATDAELERLAKVHFAFEVFALIDGLNHIDEEAIRRGRAGTGVAPHLLHTHDLLLHTRVLADFLRCAKDTCPHKSDIEAWDYIESWPGRDVLGNADKDHIDKALAHLSLRRLAVGRIDPSKRVDMANRVLEGLLEFIEALPADRRPWFTRSEVDIRATLAPT